MMNYETLEMIITGFVLGWLNVKLPIVAAAVELLSDLFRIKNTKVRAFLVKPFECFRCSGFWITLIMTQNIVLAACVAFLLELWDNHLNYIKL